MAATLILIAAVALSLIYMGLALATLPNVKLEKRTEQRDWLLAVTFWWPFYTNLYDGSDRERRLRLLGKLLVPVIAATYIAYFMGVAR